MFAVMLQSRSLAACRGVRHAFFTREGGVSTGIYHSLNGGLGSRDDPEHVRENRTRMAAHLGVKHLGTAHQIHSPRVVVAETAWRSNGPPRADGIVTRTAGLAIGITTADCGPVLLADVNAGVIGAAHAGWRGALDGIIEATVAAMEGLGAQRARIIAALGPMIRQASYEVGAELVAQFVRASPANAGFFVPTPREDRARFDLGGFIVRELALAKVGHIEDLGHCTYADPGRFFSFRRATHHAEPDYGRHINAIALVT
jgi:polyphenol oxidase